MSAPRNLLNPSAASPSPAPTALRTSELPGQPGSVSRPLRATGCPPGRRVRGPLFRLLLATLLGLGALASEPPSNPLIRGFAQPPDSTKPWCYWYWISDNLSREGITRDLEAMARVGIGEALIGNIFLDDVPAGKTKVLTEEWWGVVEHAIREAGRVGVNIGMFNSPGWSQSGGPWVKPEQAMRYLVSSETRVTGPATFTQRLPRPADPFQNVAVLAFPSPQSDTAGLATGAARLSCEPVAAGLDRLMDGRTDTLFGFPDGAGQGTTTFTIGIELPGLFTARSLALTPGESGWAARVELQAAGDDAQFRVVEAFAFDRSNMAIGVGPLPRGPVTRSFEPVAARRFRLVFTGVSGKAALAEINLSPAARVESFVEKQLGKMHPTPLPMWDTYLWPAQSGPDVAELAVPPGEVLNLSANLAADGTLRWEVPAGEWVILRLGMTPTGTRNSPASPEGQGLEIDKMNREAARMHFEAFIGQILKRMPAADRKAFTRVVADSYEMGSQNWTDGFARTFRKRYGYDPLPWLPALTGRVVGSADESDRFLWDLRRLVADHVATDYVGGLRDLCRPHGLQLWLENYGHWGFPAEFLQYGGQSDRIGGEFWVTGDLGSIELRAASSCANTYGKPIVSAEAFTGGPAFQTAPAGLKARGDWAFCEGISHFVLHVNIHQPWEDKVPGVNAWFGTEFNRHNTWFEPGKAWIDYLRGCCFLLQQGWRVADVAYFIGEDAPKMTGVRAPALPAGCDFDFINAEVILDKLSVKDGRLTLPHGTSYRVLVLPELETMRPAVLRKIRALVKAGATILGPPPARSPSLEDYPKCDAEVRRLAAELWGREAMGSTRGPRVTSGGPPDQGGPSVGKGSVIVGHELGRGRRDLGAGPDFQSSPNLRFTHRRAGNTDLYFVANPQPQEIAAMAAFRVDGKAPELWWPDSGRIERPAVFEVANGVVSLPLQLGPHGSAFVVFREPATGDRIVSVHRDGELLLDARWSPPPPAAPSDAGKTAANNFAWAAWVKPTADTTILRESNRAVSGLSEPRNDVVFPPHGDGFGGAGHAGSGFAVGRNGVVVFEHGANYFAPVLVHATPLTNWTHVAILYRGGQPALYLDGVLVHRGLRSDFTVHPGAAGGGTPFRGEVGPIEQFPETLPEARVAELAGTMPRPGKRPAATSVQLTRDDAGGFAGDVWQPGGYGLKFASGRTERVSVEGTNRSLELLGPWEVAFAAGSGAPEAARFDALLDWTQHPDARIKHHSGKAVYRTTFSWSPETGASHLRTRPTLNLGHVRDLATVRLNGQNLGTLWMAPWIVDVEAALRPGTNVLEVEVVNPWNNRLVGDASLPPEQRQTWLAAPTVTKNTPLIPAGLLGPVVIEEGCSFRLPPATKENRR